MKAVEWGTSGGVEGLFMEASSQVRHFARAWRRWPAVPNFVDRRAWYWIVGPVELGITAGRSRGATNLLRTNGLYSTVQLPLRTPHRSTEQNLNTGS